MNASRLVALLAVAALLVACTCDDMSLEEAVLSEAEDDLACKRADIAFAADRSATSMTSARVSGCAKTATYDCSSSRDCGWRCSLRGSVVRP